MCLFKGAEGLWYLSLEDCWVFSTIACWEVPVDSGINEFLKTMFPLKDFLHVSRIYNLLHPAEQTIPRKYWTIHSGEMTSQEGFHCNLHTNQVYKSPVALKQFYKEPRWMHNLRQKLNSLNVPVFYRLFPVAVLIYVRSLFSKYSFSQVSVLCCRAGLEWAPETGDWCVVVASGCEESESVKQQER